jgi:hypothetical protein
MSATKTNFKIQPGPEKSAKSNTVQISQQCGGSVRKENCFQASGCSLGDPVRLQAPQAGLQFSFSAHNKTLQLS